VFSPAEARLKKIYEGAKLRCAQFGASIQDCTRRKWLQFRVLFVGIHWNHPSRIVGTEGASSEGLAHSAAVANVTKPEKAVFMDEFFKGLKFIVSRGGLVIEIRWTQQSDQTLSQDLNRVMNRLKALYRGWGIACGGTQVYAPRYRDEWLGKIEHAGGRRRAELLYQQLDGLQALRRTLRSELFDEVIKNLNEDKTGERWYWPLTKVGMAGKAFWLKMRDMYDAVSTKSIGVALEIADSIGDSLSTVFPVLEPVLELKEMAESRVKYSGDKPLLTTLNLSGREQIDYDSKVSEE